MTKEEVRAYLQTYCGIDLREEYCTLENVLNLIPNVKGAGQYQGSILSIQNYFVSLSGSNYLTGNLIISRNDDGLWTLNWDQSGIIGKLPQDKDLMTAALYMCEFCVVNGIRLNIKKLKE